MREMAEAYVSVLALAGIQFWIGMRSKNFIVPTAIGLAGWMAGMMLLFKYQSSWCPYFPYTYSGIRYSLWFKSKLTLVGWLSLGYMLAFLIFGYLDFRRRKMAK